MTLKTQGDVQKPYANTTVFYMKDCSILGFCYLRGPWNQIPRNQGMHCI